VVSAGEWEVARERLLVKEEALGSVWTFLDLTPLRRQEEWEDSPAAYPQTPPYTWWRRHDEYDETAAGS
jgi:predicted dithiol-disulfide oxidoreductase (DUF899 family)